jgi:hypothetical protein
MSSRYPGASFCSTTLEPPHHGLITGHVPAERSRYREVVLWRCDHDHATAEEAIACAGAECGMDGKT